MPFDPVSSVGIVGTTAGLLSFLVSTVENTTVKYNNYKDCAKKLRKYSHSVETTLVELDGWSCTWSQQRGARYIPYEDEAYELFWGTSGFENIIARSKVIDEEIKAIAEIFACRKSQTAHIDWKILGDLIKGPSNDDVSRWHRILVAAGPGNRRPQIQQGNETWISKFIFAIYRNTTLKARVDNLQQLVGELKKTSVLLYRLENGASSGELDDRMLQQESTLMQERKSLQISLQDLYHDHVEHGLHWNLVLGSPSLDLALSRLRGLSKALLRLFFIVHGRDGASYAALTYPTFLNQPRDEVVTNLHGSRELLRTDIQQLTLRPLDPNDVANASTYTLAAMSVARSAILLYRSPWVNGICSCGISINNIAVGQQVLGYSPTDTCDHVGKCRYNVFLLLAKLLAELAIGRPFWIRFPQVADLPIRDIPNFVGPFFVDSSGAEMDWDALSELISERLYEAEHPFVTVEYLEAMQYCYEAAQMFAARDLRNSDFDVCITKIETP
jgi:hypothetical protein